MTSLNLGPHHDHDHDHHSAHQHTDKDHRSLKVQKRSSTEHHMEHEGNSSWDQVR